jgi:hypothetical protein
VPCAAHRRPPLLLHAVRLPPHMQPPPLMPLMATATPSPSLPRSVTAAAVTSFLAGRHPRVAPLFLPLPAAPLLLSAYKSCAQAPGPLLSPLLTPSRLHTAAIAELDAAAIDLALCRPFPTPIDRRSFALR